MSFGERAAAIISEIKFKDWDFPIRGDGDGPMELRIAFLAPDSFTGEKSWQFGRPWKLVENMTDSEIVKTVWAAIFMAIEHEAREEFTYKGRRIFGPHIDIDAMWRNARKVG